MHRSQTHTKFFYFAGDGQIVDSGSVESVTSETKTDVTVTRHSEDGDQFRARCQVRPDHSTQSAVSVTRETMCGSRRLVDGPSIMRLVGTFFFFLNAKCLRCTKSESFPGQVCQDFAIPRSTWCKRFL